MGGALWDLHGGIIGLLSIVVAHHIAVEGELIRRGLRLRDVGSDRCTWSDLKSIIYTTNPGSYLATVLGVPWATMEYMLANVVDLLNAGNWQRSGDKRARRPKPMPRPGDNDDATQKFGADPIAPEDFEDWWENG